MKKTFLTLLACWSLQAQSQNLIINGSFEDNDGLNPSEYNPQGGGVCWHGYNLYWYELNPIHDFRLIHLFGETIDWIQFYYQSCPNWQSGKTWWHNNWQEVGVDSPAVFDQAIADSLVALRPDSYSHVFGDGHWYSAAQEGDWFVGVWGHDSVTYGGPYESVPWRSAFSLALSEPLQVGEWYQLRYWIMPPQLPKSGQDVAGTNSVLIGFSMQDSLLGDSVHLSYFPNGEEDTTWILQETYFQAQQPYEHLTCAGYIRHKLYNKRILFVDNFSLEWCPSPCDTTTTTEPPENPIDSNEVGLSEHTKQSLRVHPNPFSQELHIESKAHHLRIYDLMGKEQHRQVLSGRSQKLDLNHLPQGLYLLKTYNAQGQEIDQEKVLKIQY